jgi:hypothetical protein
MKIKQIRKLNTLTFPKSLVFFDTESYIDHDNEVETDTLRLGVLIYVKLSNKSEIIDRYEYRFRTSSDFWNILERISNKEKYLWVFAHNIKYDLLNVNVIDLAKSNGWHVPFPINSHNFIMSAFKYKPQPESDILSGKKPKIYKRIQFVDTFNYMKISIKSMGEKFGIKKLNVDFENVTDTDLFTYCLEDVKIAEKMILDLIQFLYKNNLGSLKTTIAATAFNVFRHKFNNSPIFYHDDKKLLAFERQAYRGGDVQCYWLDNLPPQQTYYNVDVNSMYVWAMSECELPTKPITIINNPISTSEFTDYVNEKYVIADVLIHDENIIGLFGLKHNFNTKNEYRLIFPNGTYRITLHNPELIQALKRGMIKQIFSLVVYEKSKALKDYALFFSHLKQNSTSTSDYELSKLFGNSLYGRFALRHYETETIDWNFDVENKLEYIGIVVLDTHINENEIKREQYYRWYNQICRSVSNELIPVKNTNIALAGSVTAYSRMKLYEYKEIAGLENIYYNDTDSLFTNS